MTATVTIPTMELSRAPISMEDVGACVLVHGPTSAGKTMSSLTMPQPILHINKEPKDPKTVHGVGHNVDITYGYPKNYDEIMSYLNQLIIRYEKGERPFAGIFHDGLTFSNAMYKQAVEDDRYIARTLSKNDLPRPGMTDKYKPERPDWGTIASMMARETSLLNRLSQFGVVVVSTAISTEYPKWNQGIRMAPTLIGQEFPKLVHGYFDYIGYIIQPYRRDPQGNPIVPRISFVPREDDMGGMSYMARNSCTAIDIAEACGQYAPLNWTKILRVIRGK